MEWFEIAIAVLVLAWAFAALGYFLVSLERRRQWALDIAQTLRHLPTWPFM